MKRRILLTLCALLGALAAPAHGDSFPSKPIRLVVPFNPGGSVDALARKLAPGLGTRLGASVLVENKAGGNTVIASQYVANASPDGYTLYVTLSAPYSILPSLYKRPLPYDPKTGFTHIGIAAEIIYGLAVSSETKIGTVREYVDFAKKNPGRLTYGSTGPGQALTLSMELLKAKLEIDTLHVPFTGQAPVAAAMLGGQVDSAMMDVGLSEQHIKTGKMRMLALASNARSPLLPDVPTLREAGVALDIPPLWIGLVGPKGIPQPIVERLNDALDKEMRTPQMLTWLTGAALAPMTSTPKQMSERIASETQVWSGVIRQLGVSLD
ncbi:tripartite tricarboxylate transporter substrate binding protein [Variovorax sp. KK3]|uniref:Bug family tripartite tricarboxylate transporter substrate binding protein n=1 Tax=Variovorax sp. KK3 TaxID=1855728 RepID=UPI00097BDFDC|nr:tripartite tricarboxylate transporter substrate binding protein [Variovorax sp. KK3]